MNIQQIQNNFIMISLQNVTLFYSYNELIGILDTKNNILHFNINKYSSTTTKHQNFIKTLEVNKKEYTLQEFTSLKNNCKIEFTI